MYHTSEECSGISREKPTSSPGSSRESRRSKLLGRHFECREDPGNEVGEKQNGEEAGVLGLLCRPWALGTKLKSQQ